MASADVPSIMVATEMCSRPEYTGHSHCFWRRCTQCVITLDCCGSTRRLVASMASASG